MHATHTLMEEHQTILRVLAAAEVLVSDPRFEEEPVDTYNRFATFLRSYADHLHHRKEEALLFPAMVARGMSTEEGPIAAMLYEHDLGRALVSRMLAASDVANEEFDRVHFGQLALEFIPLLRSHIAKEDHILYPMAERLLTGSTMSQLASAYEKAEERDFPADIHETWEGWARELAERTGTCQDRYEATPSCAG